jgi:uncharacterized membrane protein
MAELIVVGFKKDLNRASEVLNKLSMMDYDWAVDLHDAVAVYRDYKGKLRVDQSYKLTPGEGAGWGFFWGAMIGALIAIPVTAGASGAAAAAALAAGAAGGGLLGATGGALDADWWKHEFGIPEEFVKSMGHMVGKGDSAILAILRTADPIAAAEQFRGYGGTVLQTTLTSEQSRKVEAILTGKERRLPKVA